MDNYFLSLIFKPYKTKVYFILYIRVTVIIDIKDTSAIKGIVTKPNSETYCSVQEAPTSQGSGDTPV